MSDFKILPPKLKQENVPRTRCLNIVANTAFSTAVLITAPAGTGKSTLLRQLYEQARLLKARCIWIQLDENDQKIEDLWCLLIKALGAALPDIVDDPAYAQPPATYTRAIELCNAMLRRIEQHTQKIIVSIDDIHFLKSSETIDLLMFLLLNRPDNLKFIFAGRHLDHPSIADMKVKRLLIELNWDQLQFDHYETECILSQDFDIAADRHLIDEIFERTEGWVAGLQLALLHIRLSGGDERSLANYVSEAQGLTEYFTNEIYAQLPNDIRIFICQTVGLRRMNHQLVAYALEITDEESRGYFQRLNNLGLFVIDLDEEDYWKRYHHLFRDLVAYSARNEPAYAIEHIQKRACKWLEANGSTNDAIEQAIQASHYELAGTYIEKHAIELFNRGAVHELASWIQRFPHDVIVNKPQLPLMLCFVMAHLHKPLQEIESGYQLSKTTIETLNAVGYFSDKTEYEQLKQELHAVSALVAFRSGEMKKVIQLVDEIHAQPNLMRAVIDASLTNIKGYAHYTLGQYDDAHKAFRQSSETHHRADCTFGVVFAECFQGLLASSRGETDLARTHYDYAASYAERCLSPHSLPASIAYLYQFVLRYDLNEIDGIDQKFTAILNQLEHCCEPEVYAAGLIAYYKIKEKQGANTQESSEALATLVAYTEQIGHPSIKLRVLYERVVALLKMDKVSEASQLFLAAQSVWKAATDSSEQTDDRWERHSFWYNMIRAEILQAHARPRDAIDLYKAIFELCGHFERNSHRIIVGAKLAIAYSSIGDTEKALAILRETVKATKQTGLVRLLADVASVTQNLLEILADSETDTEMLCYTKGIIALFDNGQSDVTAKTSTFSTLLSELTKRELDILRLLIAGLKNRQICSELNMSENTVKWHLKKIYTKLGAKNRTDAAMIAKSLFAAI